MTVRASPLWDNPRSTARPLTELARIRCPFISGRLGSTARCAARRLSGGVAGVQHICLTIICLCGKPISGHILIAPYQQGFVAMSAMDASVSQWIEGLRAGDEVAAAKLWQRYYRRLVGLACKKLGSAPRRAADEEDVVLSAFQSFCQRVGNNQFPDLRDRHNLWHLIVRITERKAYDQLRAQRRKKRGSGLVAGESALRILGHRTAAPASTAWPVPSRRPNSSRK